MNSKLVGGWRRHMQVQHRHALLLVDIGEVMDGIFGHQDISALLHVMGDPAIH